MPNGLAVQEMVVAMARDFRPRVQGIRVAFRIRRQAIRLRSQANTPGAVGRTECGQRHARPALQRIARPTAVQGKEIRIWHWPMDCRDALIAVAQYGVAQLRTIGEPPVSPALDACYVASGMEKRDVGTHYSLHDTKVTASPCGSRNKRPLREEERASFCLCCSMSAMRVSSGARRDSVPSRSVHTAGGTLSWMHTAHPVCRKRQTCRDIPRLTGANGRPYARMLSCACVCARRAISGTP